APPAPLEELRAEETRQAAEEEPAPASPRASVAAIASKAPDASGAAGGAGGARAAHRPPGPEEAEEERDPEADQDHLEDGADAPAPPGVADHARAVRRP